MDKLINLGGLLFIIYFWYNYSDWSLSINENNIVSSYIVSLLNKIPLLLVNTSIIIMIIFYLLSFFIKKRSIFLYIVSLILSDVLIKISINTLMLEDISKFFLFNIHHPISLDLKLAYFVDVLQNAKEYVPSQHFINLSNVGEIKEFFQQYGNLGKIKSMNAKEIQNYVYDLLNAKIQYENLRVPNIMNHFMHVNGILAICGMLYYYSWTDILTGLIRFIKTFII